MGIHFPAYRSGAGSAAEYTQIFGRLEEESKTNQAVATNLDARMARAVALVKRLGADPKTDLAKWCVLDPLLIPKSVTKNPLP